MPFSLWSIPISNFKILTTTGICDFLVTNGDTDADPFNTLKNYHGVRIYLNNGLNEFRMAYFYPMYGAHFAKASDFDGDGDLDIAASAFFPDFAADKPEQFVYLQNIGELNFQPFTHSATYDGRFMTLDVGDIDLDGDPRYSVGWWIYSSRNASRSLRKVSKT